MEFNYLYIIGVFSQFKKVILVIDNDRDNFHVGICSNSGVRLVDPSIVK